MEELQPPKLGIQVQILSGRQIDYDVVLTKKTLNGSSYDSDRVSTENVIVWQHQLIHVEQEVEVGYVDLVETMDGHWETHMYIDDDVRGMGFGVLLMTHVFETAIVKNLFVMSSTYTSDDAIRLWESRRLNDAYLIEQAPASNPLNERIVLNEDGTIKKRRDKQYALKGKRHR